MTVFRFPPAAISRFAKQSAIVRRLLLVLAVAGVLLNGIGLSAATAGLPAPESVTVSQGMPCCDPADHAAGPVTGTLLKSGMMGCPVVCGGWPVQALPLPVPLAQPVRLPLPPQLRPDSLDLRPAHRPPILRL